MFYKIVVGVGVVTGDQAYLTQCTSNILLMENVDILPKHLIVNP